MIFSTWPFLVFMTVVFVCYWWVVPGRYRRAFLLLASLAYFTYNYPPHTLLLGALTLTVYAIGNTIHHLKAAESGAQRARIAFIAGVMICAGTLCFYKYSRMALGVYNSLADDSLKLPPIMVPLGISFFTFEFIHYLTDLYQGRVARTSLLDFSLFAFFFPSLVSGPIKRFQIFQEQTRAIDGFKPTYLSDGLRRVTLGLAKKIIVADTAHLLAQALQQPEPWSAPFLWLAMYAYAVKIYYDFSGFTDIAIGLGQMFGYNLPENFNKPYRRSNLSLFWNNWHMSLSSWIRDYLFIPLGGSRGSKLKTIFNLTLVMAICGLWHGANWNFVAWGLWHGLGLAVLRIYRPIGARIPDTRPVRWLSTAVTIQYVCFGWVLFAAQTSKQRYPRSGGCSAGMGSGIDQLIRRLRNC